MMHTGRIRSTRPEPVEARRSHPKLARDAGDVVAKRCAGALFPSRPQGCRRIVEQRDRRPPGAGVEGRMVTHGEAAARDPLLEPCPICGSRRIYTIGFGGEWWCLCRRCGEKVTGRHVTAGAAMRAWNKEARWTQRRQVPRTLEHFRSGGGW